MRKYWVRGVLAVVALMAASEGAYAANVNIDCTAQGVDALATEFNTTHPGGQANTTYRVTGPCNGNFIITQSNISIAGSSGKQGINGSIEVFGAGGTTSLVSLFFAPGSIEIDASQAVLIDSCIIQSNSVDAIAVYGPARINVSSNTIQSNGGIGLRAQGGAVVNSVGNTINGNSTIGVLVERGSAVDSEADTISLSSSASNSPAAVAKESSSLRLISDTVAGPSNNHTVLVSQGSSALVGGSNITADTPFNANNALAVIAAQQNSTVTLAGNTITNSAAGGAAVLVSEGSTVVQNNGIPEGFAVVSDTVNGDGRVNTQSVIELGAAAGGGSITWTGNVVVSQFSSFRADGDNVTITGTLSLGQAGNAYFNHTKGTSNNIAQVVCQSTTDHVANPTLVTPNATIGPSPPACQAF